VLIIDASAEMSNRCQGAIMCAFDSLPSSLSVLECLEKPGGTIVRFNLTARKTVSRKPRCWLFGLEWLK
jgi:hypothetical protein